MLLGMKDDVKRCCQLKKGTRRNNATRVILDIGDNDNDVMRRNNIG